MIIRGTSEDVRINRAGRLAPGQLERLRRLTPYRLPALPGLLIGALLAVYGGTRQDTVGWVIVGLGLYLALSSWLRFRQQTKLKAGETESFVGVLERAKPSPMAAFEAELTIGGQNYVLLSELGDAPLRSGTRYHCHVVNGISRMGIIVSMEDA
ncbi:MAG TPA: hypothetical protein VGE07_02545 [Herpetosiphonaceae bacterium]